MARLVLVWACLALSACGGAKKPEEAGNASGKVLPGSISDSMIHLDQSRAEASLAGPGSGVPIGENEAARDLLAPTAAVNTGTAASEAPAELQDQPVKAPPAASATGARDKPAEKSVEPAAVPARPAAKAATKPKPKPAFSKPSDDGGA
jgi:hypothetical protein